MEVGNERRKPKYILNTLSKKLENKVGHLGWLGLNKASEGILSIRKWTIK
jgi:hypothetical protein